MRIQVHPAAPIYIYRLRNRQTILKYAEYSELIQPRGQLTLWREQAWGSLSRTCLLPSSQRGTAYMVRSSKRHAKSVKEEAPGSPAKRVLKSPKINRPVGWSSQAWSVLGTGRIIFT